MTFFAAYREQIVDLLFEMDIESGRPVRLRLDRQQPEARGILPLVNAKFENAECKDGGIDFVKHDGTD